MKISDGEFALILGGSLFVGIIIGAILAGLFAGGC